MAKGLMAGLKGVDAFGKTTDDVKVKTRTGAFLTLVSAAIIISFTLMEFVDYRDRGEKLSMRMNITFPRVPCYLISVDVMDISGEAQRDITQNIRKHRLDPSGAPIRASKLNGLKNEIQKNTEKSLEAKGPNYCGSCQGAPPLESGCCNTCEEVRLAYSRRGLSFQNPEWIEQCKSEGWVEKLQEQANEGCNVGGRIRVNKVVGNIHLSPGKSFQSSNSRDVYELVPYLREDGNKHDYSHTIHELFFETDDDSNYRKARITGEIKKRLGVENPLTNITMITRKPQYMYQYFLKVVSTQFGTLDGNVYKSSQYSVTHYERDISEGNESDTPQGLRMQHDMYGTPGVFFNFEISPILVVHTDTRQSLAHFMTSTCAIVGGVLTVAQLFDSVVFATTRTIKNRKA
ncbi:endoplasmic reticulum vesicle transporter-domain-containing protein [Rhodocollybia butyracea]|uniref:Endoplasmic reticulum vesicle transporter-domain-containing protein n=1 Tax=Rhodocollybia butyracea TaxID=206335 RepID=A0A9P5PQ20_9AGAR|nr:endoplasmic reticulum vesicle transporter-domain-containing protein [Rhodocollybia butyracea]